MKQFRFSFFLLLIAGVFALMSSCSQNELDPVEGNAEAEVQLAIENPKDVICCVECPSGCILAFDFDQTKKDPQHPQGSYVIQRIEGDCECGVNGNGVFTGLTTGPATITTARWGGPASSSPCNIGLGVNLAWYLFGDYCGTSTILPKHIPDYEWEDWFDELDSLRAGYDSLGGGADPYTGPINFAGGLINSAATIETISPGGTVRVSLKGALQAQALDHIRIFSNGTRDLIAELPANGDLSYDLVLAGLPIGDYTLELEFEELFRVSANVRLEEL